MRWQKAHLWYQSSDASKGLSQSVKALELLKYVCEKCNTGENQHVSPYPYSQTYFALSLVLLADIFLYSQNKTQPEADIQHGKFQP